MVSSIEISKVCDSQTPSNPCNHAKCIITLRDGRERMITEVGQFDTTILIEGVKSHAKVDAWALEHFSFDQYLGTSCSLSIIRTIAKVQAPNYLSELFKEQE